MKRKLIAVALLLAGCKSDPYVFNTAAVGVVAVKQSAGKCPCEGKLECYCNWETGAYSWSDGCNTHSCNVDGLCMATALYCPPPDWRTR